VTLKKEGINIKEFNLQDPIYFRDQKQGKFVLVDETLYGEIVSGKII